MRRLEDVRHIRKLPRATPNTISADARVNRRPTPSTPDMVHGAECSPQSCPAPPSVWSSPQCSFLLRRLVPARDAARAGMIALRKCSTSIALSFSGRPRSRHSQGFCFFLRNIAMFAIKLANEAPRMIGSNHRPTPRMRRKRTAAASTDRATSSFQSPINFTRIAYRTNSAVDEIPSLRMAEARWLDRSR